MANAFDDAVQDDLMEDGQFGIRGTVWVRCTKSNGASCLRVFSIIRMDDIGHSRCAMRRRPHSRNVTHASVLRRTYRDVSRLYSGKRISTMMHTGCFCLFLALTLCSLAGSMPNARPTTPS